LADAFRVLKGRERHVEDIGVHLPSSKDRPTSLTHVLDALRGAGWSHRSVKDAQTA
jgi:hypothetical protein